MSKQIIFVCTGNTCRSPLAESYAKTKSGERNFASRGIMVTESSVNPLSKQIIEEEKIEGPSNPQELTEADTSSSILLTMTSQHKSAIKQQYPEAEVHLLSEYAAGSDENIADPVGGSYNDYRETYAQMKSFIDKLFK